MEVEYEAVCAKGEETLRASGIHLPLSWMVSLLLDYAQTGVIDPDELQDLVKQISSGLDEYITKE